MDSAGPLFAACPAMAEVEAAPTLEGELRRLFGFQSFRPGQREVIEAVLAGRDALAVMPTGGGKSLTYLLPAFLRPGLTIVISPLISLMQDQVSKLHAQGLEASVLNSQIPWEEQQRTLAALQEDRLRLLFVAPERFRNGRFLRALEGARVSLFAVDEAHCVSQWGHDFRPDYLTLDEAARRCGRPPILAVTATATRQVREDISAQLGLVDPLVVVRGLDRANLYLSSLVVYGGRQAKLRALFARLRRVPKGPGIVYCATRKNCERVAKAIKAADLGKVAVYHAGVRGPTRERVQKRFFAGGVDIVVATNAFGMGIDKQDLRFVLHHDLPGSIEAYYQEAGRAGRDGQPAECGLLYAPQDVHLQKFFIRSSHPDRALVGQVQWAAERYGADAMKIADSLPTNASGKAVEAALRLLEKADGELSAIDFVALKERERHEEQLLDHMIRYARGGVCRRRSILRYFGAPELPRGCDACDVCRPRETEGKPASAKKTTGAKKTAGAKKKTTRSRSKKKETDAEFEERCLSADVGLVQALRQLRSKLAKRKRVPAYKVFHDKTLLALAVARPTTKAELLAVHGIGERKATQYGAQVLALIAEAG